MGPMQYYSIGDPFFILRLVVVLLFWNTSSTKKNKKKYIFLDCPRKFVLFWSLAFIGQHQSESACWTDQEQPKVFSSKTINKGTQES
jgi:hypothetical protein